MELILVCFCPAAMHAVVVTYENLTPYTAQLTFKISDLARDKSFMIEPHQKKQIDLGNTLPTTSKAEFLRDNTTVVSVENIPLTKMHKLGPSSLVHFYFICDQPIDTNNRITQGKILIYAQEDRYRSSSLIKKTQPFAFPVSR